VIATISSAKMFPQGPIFGCKLLGGCFELGSYRRCPEWYYRDFWRLPERSLSERVDRPLCLEAVPEIMGRFQPTEVQDLACNTNEFNTSAQEMVEKTSYKVIKEISRSESNKARHVEGNAAA